MASVRSKRWWYHLSSDRLIVGLLAVQILLFLSQQFQWFSFNEKKGWTVLIAVAVLGLVLAVMLAWSVASLLFRWRFQFSLRSFLLMVVAIAVPAAWFAAEMGKAERQRTTVAGIRAAGGIVQFDYAWDFWQDTRATRDKWAMPELHAPEWLVKSLGEEFFAEVALVTFNNQPALGKPVDVTFLKELVRLRSLCLLDSQVTDIDLENVEKLTNLTELFLSHTQITDAGLEHLRSLAELRQLWLDDTQVTDAGLEHLKGLTCLTDLWLSRTAITDAGLESLKGLAEVEELMLNGTQVTDLGLVHLQSLPNLKRLFLNNTPITDTGLENVKRLTNLEWVDLDGTRITDAGLVHLKDMPRLRGVGVRGTRVTREAHRELLDSLPGSRSERRRNPLNHCSGHSLSCWE